MELNLNNIRQAKIDILEYDQYLKDRQDKHPLMYCQSFKELFGYEIVFFEDEHFELIGFRFKIKSEFKN